MSKKPVVLMVLDGYGLMIEQRVMLLLWLTLLLWIS